MWGKICNFFSNDIGIDLGTSAVKLLLVGAAGG